MYFFPQLDKVKGIMLDLLFPRWCVGCGKEGDFICHDCRRSMVPIVPPVCPRCGRPQVSGVLCPGCVGWQAAIDGIRAPFRFDGVVRQAVHHLKYRNLRALATTLGGMLDEYLTVNPIPAEVLVPVPLHQKRMRERGYNQSALLARELSKCSALPVVAGLVRERHTVPQARTRAVGQRRSNVTGAFSCCDDTLKGKQVLLVDDVSTSGATLDACAAALKAGGAASVWGLVLAKEL
ncbi:MAG: ComF family protein [Dehalococcoidales bacterium]|nr:ComF family protein [Dehalococcoidales bacterium]